MEEFAASGRQILPGHGQNFPSQRRVGADTRDLIFRSREKSMFKLS
jgi:hypothetical protein